MHCASCNAVRSDLDREYQEEMVEIMEHHEKKKKRKYVDSATVKSNIAEFFTDCWTHNQDFPFFYNMCPRVDCGRRLTAPYWISILTGNTARWNQEIVVDYRSFPADE